MGTRLNFGFMAYLSQRLKKIFGNLVPTLCVGMQDGRFAS
ncbi:Uncharacterized protein dnm_093600 [Desulfonema magnum]|uniref:Uncharacterized protein n=1 Tax=Desulfonema magnum TaxID=45655 RepID=A0A975BWW1_9BACT|nr:Uncharacterized protein dnm_093600 [Desulfonema magnum]